jgi:predicted outer membrane repeat protein
MSARPHLEAFEPRLLYSADALSLAMGLGAGDFSGVDAAWTQPAATLASQNAVTTRGVEIVVVDTSVNDAASLLNDLASQQRAGRQLEVLTLNAGDDGIARITELLAQRDHISALHVIGHGADGVVVLGGVQLNGTSLLARAGEVASWGRAFSADGDLLIYGCDVAASGTGQQWVDDLAALTGADVAASTDTTASSLRGGNWVLEDKTGQIQAALALSSAEQESFSGSLATIEVNRFTDDNAPGSLRWAITQANIARSTDTITLSAGTYFLNLSNSDGGANTWRDLDITSFVTLVGAGAGQTVIESQGSWRHFDVNNGSLNLSGVTLRGGSQTNTDTSNDESRGGAIYVRSGSTLVLSQSVIESSSAQNGGAIYVAGTATLTDVELRNNTARNDGGALFDAGSTTLSRVTVAQNLALHNGGGIYKNSSELTTLSNLTLSGNGAGNVGGGLYSSAESGSSGSNSGSGNDVTNVNLVNASVVNNAALGAGGGLYLGDDTQASVANSLFATNTSVTTEWTHANQNLSSSGYNLFDLAGGGRNFGLTKTGDQQTSDVKLGALANNGGITRTHALQPTSGAINSVSPTTSTPAPSTDQRNVARQGTADIGAYEYINAAPYFSNAVLTIGAGGSSAPIVDIFDAEGDSVVVSVVAATHGYFTQDAGAPAEVTSFAAVDFLYGKIRFVHDGSAVAPTFTLRANDALNTSANKVGTVYFTPPNSAPVTGALVLASGVEDTSRTITQAQLLAGITDANGDPLVATNLQLLTAGSVQQSTTLLPASSTGPITSTTGFGVGGGLKGEYYNNVSFNGSPVLTRTEAVDFNWGQAAPSSAVPSDNFSVNWTGHVVPPSSGNYVFRTESDDGIRVWVNNVLVIDAWTDHSVRADVSNAIALQANTAYAIRVAYFESGGSATARLQWQTPGSSGFSAIPAARLFSSAPTAPANWTFTPTANWNGTAKFSYSVSDGRGGVVNNTASLVVAPVNDAPTITSNQLTLSEGSTVVPQISAADADNPASNTLTFTASNVSNGRFALTSNLSAAITQFTQKQVTDGVVRFVHDGSNAAPSYRLTVKDAGNATSNFSQGQINFTNVNDAPVFVTNTLNISNGASAVPVIAVTDADHSTAQLAMTVSNLSGGGFLLSGSSTTSFTQAQVDIGLVSFVHDGLGIAPTYRLTVTDTSGATASRDVLVEFNNPNATPVFVANTLNLAEGDVATPVISITDSNDANPNRLTITVSDLVGGYFANSTDLNFAVTSFTQLDVDSGAIRFVHDGSSTGPSYRLTVNDPTGAEATSVATVTFTQVNDAPVFTVNALSITQGGSAVPLIEATDEDNTPAQLTFTVSNLSGGQFELANAKGASVTQFTQAQLDRDEVRFVDSGSGLAPAYTLTLSDGVVAGISQIVNIQRFTPLNDRPLFTQNSLTISEGGSAKPSIRISDPDNSSDQLLITVSGLHGGHFELNGPSGLPAFEGGLGTVVQEVIDSFTLAQLKFGDVIFVHDGSEQAPSYTLTVTDTDGATDISELSDVLFTTVNDLPYFEENRLVIREGSMAVPNIKAVDADNTAADLSISVTAVSGGRFELVSNAGQAITSFTQSQIDKGLVRFVDAGQGSPPTYSVAVDDPASQAETTKTSLLSSVGTVNFTAVNDAPVFTSNRLEITEGETAKPSINVTDEDHSAAQINITVSALTGGRFEFINAKDVAITSFTQADLDAGTVRFVHDGSDAAPNYTLTATDLDGAISTSARSSVNFSAVNDKPVFNANSLSVAEGDAARPSIRVSDEESRASQITITVSALTGGRFEYVATKDVAIVSFTQADLDAGKVRFVHDGSGAAPVYTLTATDADGAQSSSALSNVDFTAVNDKPVFAVNALTVREGGIAAPLIQVTDEDNSAAELRFSISALAGGRFELRSAPGLAITQFTQAQLDAGAVRFVHDGSETVPAYALSVNDVEGALATSTGPALNYTPVNDAPVILSHQLRITEAGFAMPSITVSDVDTPAARLNFTVSAVSGGHFELNGAPGADVLNFSQAQIDADVVRFVHDGSSDAPRYRLSLSDGDNVLDSDAVVTFTRLPPAPAAVVAVTTTTTSATNINTSANTGTATLSSTATPAKPTNNSAADVLTSRAAAAEAAAAEAAVTEAQASALAAFNRTAATPSASVSELRDNVVRVAASTSANSPGVAAEVDPRWASASVAPGSVNVPNLLLTGDANSLDWSSSSSSLLDRKLLDAVLGSSDSSARNTALDKAFERIREELDQGAQADGQAVAGSLVLSTSFSVGYVLWLARGGVLLASMASSIPAWATVDPLPVLSRFKSRHGEGDDGLGGPDDDANGDKADALERLFSKAKKVFSGGEAATPSPVPPAPTPAHTPAHTRAPQHPALSATESSGVPP